MTRPAKSLLSLAILALMSGTASADVIKVGVIGTMSGPYALFGANYKMGIDAYVAEHGNKVGNHTVEFIYKDEEGPNPAKSKALAQELIVKDKVQYLAGIYFTPNAMAVAPLLEESKTPLIVLNAATSAIVEKSPYIVRTSFTMWQNTVPAANIAWKSGSKKVAIAVSDYGPGIDAEKFFKSQFLLNGGKVIGEIRSPLRSPDFAPFLQKVADLKPDAVFCFLPSGQGAAFMKQFGERGLDKSGIKLIATGDVVDDDQLNDIGDVALGVVNSHHYSAAHPSAMNKKFVAAFEAANKFRPNFMAVAGYDGMRVIYTALATTKGKAGGDALLEAMKGQIFESPRGQMMIDAQTRDVVQDIYIRKVERVNGQLYNQEFDVQKSVKDPGKLK